MRTLANEMRGIMEEWNTGILDSWKIDSMLKVRFLATKTGRRKGPKKVIPSVSSLREPSCLSAFVANCFVNLFKEFLNFGKCSGKQILKPFHYSTLPPFQNSNPHPTKETVKIALS
jgi:hypothetical protein